MNNVSLSFLADDMVSNEELDQLFSQLEQFEAPLDAVANIMDIVAQLPQHQLKSNFYLEGFQQMIVSLKRAQLC